MSNKDEVMFALTCCIRRNCADCPRHEVRPSMTDDYIGPCREKRISIPENLCNEFLDLTNIKKN